MCVCLAVLLQGEARRSLCANVADDQCREAFFKTVFHYRAQNKCHIMSFATYSNRSLSVHRLNYLT